MTALLPQILPLLIPLAILALVMRRATRGRKVRVERLWIAPAIALVGGVAVIALQPQADMTTLGVEAAAFILGGALGWYRGAFTRLSVDATTHEITSKASTAGVVLVLAAFAVRYCARFFLREEAGSLHITTTLITDAFVVFAIGMVTVQRLEIWLRASRLLAEARAAKSAAPAPAPKA